MTQETFPMIVGGEETLNEPADASGKRIDDEWGGLCPLHRHTLFRYPK